MGGGAGRDAIKSSGLFVNFLEKIETQIQLVGLIAIHNHSYCKAYEFLGRQKLQGLSLVQATSKI